MPYLKRLFTGDTFTICAIASGDRCVVESDLGELKRKKHESYDKISFLLQRVASYGFRELPKTKFEHLGDDCYEIKQERGLVRVFAFKDTKRNVVIVVKNVWEKGNKKEQNQQIQELKKFKKKYESELYPMEDN